MDSIETIYEHIKEWAADNIGKSFTFRQNQLEAIGYIINSVVNNKYKVNTIQAPTGTGKSLICIISAGVLSKYYNLKSYILASDLYLWQQYADAIDKYRLKDFGYLKGSQGNYYCKVSCCDFQYGKCKIEKIGLNKLRKKDWRDKNGYSCVDGCIYMQQRFRAEKAPVTLLTYQLWLAQMNLVDHSDGTGFLKRNVIFCDECHNIPSIVQSYSQPIIDAVQDREKLERVLQYALNRGVESYYQADCINPKSLKKFVDKKVDSDDHPILNDVTDINTVMKNFDYFIDCLHISEQVQHAKVLDMDILRDFNKMLCFISRAAQQVLDGLKDERETVLKKKKEKGYKKNDDDKDILAAYKVCSWATSYALTIYEFIRSSKEAGAEFVIVEENIEYGTNKLTYSINCVREDYLIYNYLLKNCDNAVMTSATVGNKQSFMDNIGARFTEEGTAHFVDLPNIFDFSKSPIYYIPHYKMSMANKKEDFPKIQQLIYKIAMSPTFLNQRGMINTGSYANAKAIYDNAPRNVKQRLLMYNTAKDKNVCIETYTKSKNKILIGPTLVEGVDLPGDLCRFIIIAKVPFPNIGSKQIKAKMELFPLWYDSTTSNNIIQNIGRGVRNESDYCTTFIVDGCFGSLYSRTISQYPLELQRRIITLNNL